MTDFLPILGVGKGPRAPLISGSSSSSGSSGPNSVWAKFSAYWNLTSNTIDNTNNGNNPSVVGPPTFNTAGMTLDGATQWAYITNPAQALAPANSSLTVVGWVTPTTGTGTHIFMGMGNPGTTNPSPWILKQTTLRNLTFAIKDTGGNVFSVSRVNGLVVGATVFCVAIFDSVNQLIEASVGNGAFTTTSTAGGTNALNQAGGVPFMMGGDSSISTPADLFSGTLLAFGVAPSVLTAADLTYLFNNGFPKAFGT